MTLQYDRRRLARLASLVLLAGCAQAWGQPAAAVDKPLRIVVGYPPGQTTDAIARQYAAALGKELGRPVIVDNKAGANGIVGAQEAKRAAADGNTVLFATSGQLAINPSLYKKLPYDPLKDFVPVATIFTGPLYLVAHPAFPPNNVQELVAYAKAKPGKVDFGSGGQGITAHLAMEMLQAQAGIKLNHVPYKGSPAAMNDLMGGQIALMFEPGPSVMPFVKAGKLKALGITSARRDPQQPGVATLQEQGVKDFDVAAWVAVLVPAGTPEPVVANLHAALKRASQSAQLQDGLRAIGVESAVSTRDEFDRFLHSEVKKWSKAVQLSGVQLE